MKEEEKQLLFIDLCGRLPYGVKGLHREEVHKLFIIDGREANNVCIQVDGYDAWFSVDTFKPYLRPMSSMTMEEMNDWYMKSNVEYDCEFKPEPTMSLDNCHLSTDWLNKHHFDYRGLIEKGLALEAPEDMYKTE